MHRRVPRLLFYVERAFPSLFASTEAVSNPQSGHVMTQAREKLGQVVQWTRVNQDGAKWGVITVFSFALAAKSVVDMKENEGSRRLLDMMQKRSAMLVYEGEVVENEFEALSKEWTAIEDEFDALLKENDVIMEELDADKDEEVFKERLTALLNGMKSLEERKIAFMKDWDAWVNRCEAYVEKCHAFAEEMNAVRVTWVEKGWIRA